MDNVEVDGEKGMQAMFYLLRTSNRFAPLYRKEESATAEKPGKREVTRVFCCSFFLFYPFRLDNRAAGKS